MPPYTVSRLNTTSLRLNCRPVFSGGNCSIPKYDVALFHVILWLNSGHFKIYLLFLLKKKKKNT